MNKSGQYLKLPSYIKRGITYKLGGWLFTPKPRVVVFPVNDRCNSRCIMCNRWKKEIEREISTDKIREVFSSGLFSKVERVNIHGGEPTLRSDLPEIFRIIQSSCPRVNQMWLSTNGLNPERVITRIKEVLSVVDFNKLKVFSIGVSIDGARETHERIRGIKGGFDQTVETVRMLKRLKKEYPLEVNISTVIQPLNLHELDKVERLAEDLDVPVYFIPLMLDTFFNIESTPEIRFSGDDLAAYKKTIREKCIKGSSMSSLYWNDFIGQMDGAKRKIPCAFDRYIISLYPTGEILPCSRRDWLVYGNVYDSKADDIWFSRETRNIRQRMKKEVCPTCSNMCQVEVSLEEEFFTYLKFYLKRKILNR